MKLQATLQCVVKKKNLQILVFLPLPAINFINNSFFPTLDFVMSYWLGITTSMLLHTV